MKYLILLLFTFFALQGVSQQRDTTLLSIDYVYTDLSGYFDGDSLIEKYIVRDLANPPVINGLVINQIIYRYHALPDSLLIVAEDEETVRRNEEMQRMIQESARMSQEYQAMQIMNQEAENKLQTIKNKRDKNKNNE